MQLPNKLKLYKRGEFVPDQVQVDLVRKKGSLVLIGGWRMEEELVRFNPNGIIEIDMQRLKHLGFTEVLVND